jgi:hypothetical protein
LYKRKLCLYLLKKIVGGTNFFFCLFGGTRLRKGWEPLLYIVQVN